MCISWNNKKCLDTTDARCKFYTKARQYSVLSKFIFYKLNMDYKKE